jgi:hypothetical protein
MFKNLLGFLLWNTFLRGRDRLAGGIDIDY